MVGLLLYGFVVELLCMPFGQYLPPIFPCGGVTLANNRIPTSQGMFV